MIVIVGILATFATLSIGNRAMDDRMQDEGQRFVQLFKLAEEESQIKGMPIGLRFTDKGYTFLVMNDKRLWVDYGQGVLRLLCRISLSPDTCVRMTQSIFLRWGLASMVFSKFVPGISLVAPPIAGAVRMPLGRFLLSAAAGTLLWTAAHLVLGFLFRDQIGALFDYGRQHLQVVLHLAVALLLLYIAYRGVQRWMAQRAAGVPRIGSEELRRLLELEPRPLLLDLRSDLLRQDGAGIPGALVVELAQLEREPPALPFDRDIVTYCACPNDISAVRAAMALRRRGYLRAVALRGGIDAWNADAPVVAVTVVAAK